MKKLYDMLSVARPGKSVSVKKWTEKYIDSLSKYGHLSIDKIGNRYITVGKDPEIAFTAHTDTVHFQEGILKLVENKETSTLHAVDSVLGADDGVGCFLLSEMIQNGVAGLYVFFVEEETGGVGSSYSVEKHLQIYKGIDCMISLDRRGTTNVITHQGGERTCSDEFASNLSLALNSFGLEYSPDDTGIFTDSANFVGIIPECTNLSVGYFRAHSTEEYVDLIHLQKLRDTLLKIDWNKFSTSNKKGQEVKNQVERVVKC
jgi:acetylornithine deacetylase/succinyl-diaminopimelate desuccinylase-like protein